MYVRLLCIAVTLLAVQSVGCAANATAPSTDPSAAKLQDYFDAETKELSTAFEQLKPQLGPPKDGFEWALYRDVMFLKPHGWNDLTRGDFLNSAYGASPETFTLAKNFEMGFTIQILKGTNVTRGITAKKAALLYLKPFLDAHKKEEILMLSTRTAGTTDMIFFRYKDAPAGMTPIIVHKFINSDDTLDIVHVYTFESPASSWEANWESFGTPILANIRNLGTAPLKK
jgi:hypothetical protein